MRKGSQLLQGMLIFESARSNALQSIQKMAKGVCPIRAHSWPSIPSFECMLIAILTVFVVPVLYCGVEEMRSKHSL